MKQIYYDRRDRIIDDIVGMKFQFIEINDNNIMLKFDSVKNANIIIVIQSPWRIRDSEGKIVFGCEDIKIEQSKNKIFEKWFYSNFQDVKVEMIDINEYMDVLVKFTNKMKFDIFTDSSVGEECWRIFKK